MLSFVSCKKDEESSGNPAPENYFRAEVTTVYYNTITVKPIGGQEENLFHEWITFSRKNLDKFEVQVGDLVDIGYIGEVEFGYPSKVNPVCWFKGGAYPDYEYTEEYLSTEYREKRQDDFLDKVRIVGSFKNCFFVSFEKPRLDTQPYTAKINSVLPEGYNIGDYVVVQCTNIWHDERNNRSEAELISIEPGSEA